MKKFESRCKILNNKERGKAFILSAPAGTGKTTLVDRLTSKFPQLVRSISFTTRKPRGKEQEEHDYYFISFQEFERKINKGDFIEYVEVFGNFYGTGKDNVEALLNQGYDVILVIDTQGALAIKPFFKGIYIFMGPPSIQELEKRLKARGTDSPAEIERRLSWAHNEIEQACHYDYNVINANLEETYGILKSIYIAEKYKTKH